MSHQHVHGVPRSTTAFRVGIALNLAFVIVESVMGFAVHSLALVADAGHNLSDVLGLLLAWGAAGMARQLPPPRRTYGLRRSTILAAIANALLLLVAIGAIGWGAVQRIMRHSRGRPPKSLSSFGIYEAPRGCDLLGLLTSVDTSGHEEAEGGGQSVAKV